MSPNVVQVEPIAHFKLRLFFDNGEVKQFDVTPYLDRGVFKALKDPHLFQSVKPFFGGVQWLDEQDLSADTLYCQSETDQHNWNPLIQA